MIAAEDPVEYYPHGRSCVKAYLGRMECLKRPNQCDVSLIDDFKGVTIADKKVFLICCVVFFSSLISTA